MRAHFDDARVRVDNKGIGEVLKIEARVTWVMKEILGVVCKIFR